VLVTGASSGIGIAVARELSQRGARLALTARSTDALRDVSGRLSPSPQVFAADLTDASAATKTVDDSAAALGGLDVAVVNAAAAAYGPFRSMPADDFDRTIASTFSSAVYTIRAALPYLEASEGTIVVTGSVAGKMAVPLLGPYVAAKHALRGFTRALQIELKSAGSQVGVSLVSPGPVDTPFWRNVTPRKGRMPPRLPDAYRAEDVAREIVRRAERPRREVTIGGAMAAVTALAHLAPAVADRVLARGATWAMDESAPIEDGRALWAPSGEGTRSGGLEGRPSALTTARGLLR
jgi:short-subunit dehydrogenase